MFWIILTQSKAHPELVFGDCESRNGASSQLRVFDQIEDARERKAFIQKQWPHLKAWVIELNEPDAVNECSCSGTVRGDPHCRVHGLKRDASECVRTEHPALRAGSSSAIESKESGSAHPALLMALEKIEALPPGSMGDARKIAQAALKQIATCRNFIRVECPKPT